NLKAVSYYDGFTEEVTEIVNSLTHLISDLEREEDEIFNQKSQWILYFASIIKALMEQDTTKLIKKWADVDRAWMNVTTPIQVGHPLEYYEDHYRKAVALEWDVRIINPKLQNENTTGESVKGIFSYLFRATSTSETQHVKEKVEKDIDRTKLYIGRPALFYGAEFNGLFSAQVVPNDENVTTEYGKKIFAFSDFVLEGAKAKPFSLLDREIFGEEFLKEDREVLFRKPDIWHRLYDIETIGHEYGHILWMDSDTEQKMNSSGNFKNLEEFKATAGGLVAFFENKQDPKLVRDLFISVIKRAVKLMAWRETKEVEPYYVEGIIHLTGMFQTGVLVFENEKLIIDLDKGKLDSLRVWYVSTYRSLATFYMEKQDSAYFLEQFVIKDKSDVFLPYYFEIKDFVNHYWKRYKEIGQVVDENEKKEDWLS
ncbi:MAG: invasion protein CiaB, partial [Campylobacterales bacterium]|nr:invasion protein CiaB [Campylobacterales bacterium]